MQAVAPTAPVPSPALRQVDSRSRPEPDLAPERSSSAAARCAGRSGLRRARPERARCPSASWSGAWSTGGPRFGGGPGRAASPPSVSSSATRWRSRTPSSGRWPPASGWRRSTPPCRVGGSGGLAVGRWRGPAWTWCVADRPAPADMRPRLGRAASPRAPGRRARHATRGDRAPACRRRRRRPVVVGHDGHAQGGPVEPGASCSHTARCVASHLELGSEDRGFNPLPLFHINAEVVGLLSTLVAGSCLVLDDRFHRTGFWDLMGQPLDHVDQRRARHHLALWRAPGRTRPCPAGIRFIRSASAPLPVAAADRFEASTGIPVIETYGMTEAASQITAHPLSVPRRAGSVGVPVGVELRDRPPDRAGRQPARGARPVRRRATSRSAVPSVIDGYVGGDARRSLPPGRLAAHRRPRTPRRRRLRLPDRPDRRRHQSRRREGLPAGGRGGHRRGPHGRRRWPSSAGTIRSWVRCPWPSSSCAAPTIRRRRRRRRRRGSETASGSDQALEREPGARQATGRPATSWQALPAGATGKVRRRAALDTPEVARPVHTSTGR